MINAMNPKDMIKIALETDATAAAVLETSQIRFHEDFRKACEKNLCRKYDTNWMGPPAVGPISELSKRVARFQKGLLFQTVHTLVSNFDWKGMTKAGEIHGSVFRAILGKIRADYPGEIILPLHAGCCSICPRCAYLDREPCRHPDQAVASVEAYGMNVLALQKSAGLSYYHGKNTVTYVSLILFEANQSSSKSQ